MNTVFVVLPVTGNSPTIPFHAEFCLSYMKAQLHAAHALYSTESQVTCGNLIDHVLDADVLIVMRSGVMATRPSLNRMADACLSHGPTVVGPVMVSGSADQMFPLPFSFSDIDTFQELTDWLLENRKGAMRSVSTLSQEIFCCTPPWLKRFPPNLPVEQIGNHENWRDSAKIVPEDSFAHSFSNYYRHPRMDLIALIPDTAQSILDVGCAEGAIGQYLKARRPGIRCVGIEADPIAARSAETIYDQVYCQSVENIVISERFDCMVCGDVLEHLVDPGQVLKAFRPLLNDGGSLVGSVPNVGHWTVIRGLMKGQFRYVPAGILCWDHLRFFTEDSLADMLHKTGYRMDHLGRNMSVPSPEGIRFIQWLESSGYGNDASLTTEQFVFRCGTSG